MFRQLRHFMEIVGPKGCLEEEEIELIPVLDHGETGCGIIPEILHINHQRDVVAHRLAHRGENFGMPVIALPHTAMGIGTIHGDLGLHGLEAESFRLLGRQAQGVAVFLVPASRRLQ